MVRGIQRGNQGGGQMGGKGTPVGFSGGEA